MKLDSYSTSFLDVVCCALGAAIVLFLINSSAPPGEKTRKSALLVSCDQLSGESREVGIQYWEPDAVVWRSARARDCPYHYVSGTSEDGGMALLLIADARPGKWGFRGDQGDYDSERMREPADVEIKMITKKRDRPKQATSHLPGDGTDEIWLTIP